MRPLQSETDTAPVRIPAGRAIIDADLALPATPTGLVVFAHGSGSSRTSTRNRYVASVLQEAGLATLMLDLLTADEERVDRQTREHRFDIPLLAGRLVAAADWAKREPRLLELGLGFFGSSTGAAAALIAAAERPDRTRAVVSRGGRPDLADTALEQVQAPTLLIVGGNDASVVTLNEEAMARMPAKRELAIVPGATHLFEERGKLEQVAQLARDWLLRWMS
jgi:pimeloyl-ACP methyl ester carboxylesterase